MAKDVSVRVIATARILVFGVAAASFGAKRNMNLMKFKALNYLGLAFVSACFFAATPSAMAQGVVKQKFADWEMRCETPPGASRETCALVQSVAAEDRPNINLVVIAFKTADGKNRLMRIISPLGVLIPKGIGLRIDSADVGSTGFVRCLPTGCVAEVIMDDKLIDQLKTGKTATFIIFQTPEEGIGIPLTLAGFKEGYDQIK